MPIGPLRRQGYEEELGFRTEALITWSWPQRDVLDSLVQCSGTWPDPVATEMEQP